MPIRIENDGHATICDWDTTDQLYQNIQELTQEKYAHIKQVDIADIKQEDAKALAGFVSQTAQASFAIDINLPPLLQNTTEQITLDRVISNHRLAKNRSRIASTGPAHAQSPTTKPIEARKIPTTIKPKIEMILSDDEIINGTETEQLKLSVGSEELKDTTQLPKLQRSPLAARVVEQIIAEDKKAQIAWGELSDRAKAKDFSDAKTLRETWFADGDINNHPLCVLLKNNPLMEQLSYWTQELDLKKEQYDALLDVCGQYGLEGLGQLFRTWNSYSVSEKTVLKEMHASLLKYMPTYLPFLADDQFKETLSSIMKLSDAKRSWWLALVKNHAAKSGYCDLTGLYECFTAAVKEIENLGISFNKISKLVIAPNDLSSTLSQMLAFLKKCHKQDLAEQWVCLDQVDFLNTDPQAHFLVPDMKKEVDIELDNIQELIRRNNLDKAKTAFYRYIATRKQHLPLKDYKDIIQGIFAEPAFDESARDNIFHYTGIKIKMLYVLAKATSIDSDEPFNAATVLHEWQDFQNRYVKLDYLNRIKANFNALSKGAYSFGLAMVVGGPTGTRHRAINPFVDMKYMPPMSFLNKLNNLSEYKFLDDGLNDLRKMQPIQDQMVIEMKDASNLYKQYPGLMLQAVRLIKTTTVEEKNKKFLPEAKDRKLLGTFIAACQTLINPDNDDKKLNDNQQPRNVLLPLLTVFHLEYETEQKIREVIHQYKQIMLADSEHKDLIQRLLPYGLSLFQHVQNREHPTYLNVDILKAIQKKILEQVRAQAFKTRQDVYQWVQNTYGQHFEHNEVPKDTPDIDPYLDEFKCSTENRQLISNVIKNFNLEEEQAHYKDLVKSLIKLIGSLTTTQKKRFFEYCVTEFKNGGLLARENQAASPLYIKQFKLLVDVIESKHSFDQFEQYMNVTHKQVLEDNRNEVLKKNSIEKCRYFLETLYPSLTTNKKQNVSPKDAFSFATLVCHTPLELLYTAQIQVRLGDHNEMVLVENNGHVTPLQFDQAYQFVTTFKDKKAPSGQDYENLVAGINLLCSLDKKNNDAYVAILNVTKEIILDNNKYFPQRILLSIAKRIKLSTNKLQTLQQQLSALRPPLQLMLFQDVVLLEFQQKKQKLRNQYPNILACVNEFIARTLLVSPNNINVNCRNINLLVESLIELNDQNLAFGLMYHYNGLADRRPVKNLIDLFENGDYQKLSLSTKKAVMNAIMTQVNNGINLDGYQIPHFLKHIYSYREEKSVIQYLNKYYEHAPFPTLDTFRYWTKPPIDEKKLEKKYARFDKHPCMTENSDGREQENGFHVDEAKANLTKWPEKAQTLFREDYLTSIALESDRAKGLATEAILEELKAVKGQNPVKHVSLVMLACELLHRSKGQPPEFVDGQQKLGRSFELNTTQIMAILAMFETGQRITAEIGTGEGKTRIMMIINACQFLKGNTVDFVTDNLALAERDYLASLPFFKSLGAEVNFIRKNSDVKDYKVGGIHFSDKKNLKAFRDKAAKQNQLGQTLDPDPKKRSLSLDEADTVFLDNSNITYNDSKTIPEIYLKVLPLYPLLMHFFAEGDNEEVYKNNKHRFNEILLGFIKEKNALLYDTIQLLPDLMTRLEKWEDAAYTARHLKLGDPMGYTIATNATVTTTLGAKNVAKAMCYVGPRADEDAIFAEGVHQCLHAELNRLIRKTEETGSKVEDNPELQAVLDECRAKGLRFEVFPERPSSSSAHSASDTILSYYEQGSLYAVTGTIGSEIERPEVQELTNTQFLDVPRHKDLRRLDRPALIAENEEEQINAIVAHALESRAKGQPILLICKNDHESKQVYEKLKAIMKENNKINRVHAVTDYDDPLSEAEVIKIAGKPGHILVTTEMEGRGTDIQLEGPANTVGLKVLLTYLPKTKRDLDQVLARAGRYGAVGETQMVLNLQQLKQDYGIDGLNEDYYLNPEAFIRQLQMFAEHTDQLHRLFKKAFNDFSKLINQRYQSLGVPDDAKATQAWNKFSEQYQASEKMAKETIESMLRAQPNINQIEKELQNHADRATQHWGSFLAESNQTSKNVTLPAAMTLPKLLVEWVAKLKTIATPEAVIDVQQKVTVYDRYDPAMAGRMHILKKPEERPLFANTKAAWRKFNFTKWRRGEGSGSFGTGIQFFANWHAYRKHEISFETYVRQSLPTFFKYKPINEKYMVKKKVPVIHATLGQKPKNG